MKTMKSNRSKKAIAKKLLKGKKVVIGKDFKIPAQKKA